MCNYYFLIAWVSALGALLIICSSYLGNWSSLVSSILSVISIIYLFLKVKQDQNKEKEQAAEIERIICELKNIHFSYDKCVYQLEQEREKIEKEINKASYNSLLELNERLTNIECLYEQSTQNILNNISNSNSLLQESMNKIIQASEIRQQESATQIRKTIAILIDTVDGVSKNVVNLSNYFIHVRNTVGDINDSVNKNNTTLKNTKESIESMAEVIENFSDDYSETQKKLDSLQFMFKEQTAHFKSYLDYYKQIEKDDDEFLKKLYEDIKNGQFK